MINYDTQKEVYEIAVNHGWWQGEQNLAEKIALMHSELSEALEWLRHGNPRSDHIPDYSGVEEEFADVIIRILDFSQHYKLRILSAVLAKIQFNKNREFKHGGKSF